MVQGRAADPCLRSQAVRNGMWERRYPTPPERVIRRRERKCEV